MKKKKLWLIPVIAIPVLIVIIIIVSIVIGILASQSKGNMVNMIPIDERDLSDYITLQGTLQGETKTNVGSKAAAEVLELKVQVGDAVKKGDILCVLDSSRIKEDLEKAKVNLSNSTAISNNQENQTVKSYQYALEDQKAALEEAQKTLDDAKQKYKELEDKVKANNASLDSAKKKLSKLKKAAEENPNDAEAAAAYEEQADLTNPSSLASKIVVYQQRQSAYVEQSTVLNDAVQAAQKNYDSLLTSTTRQVEAAKNSLELQKYSTDNSSASDVVNDLLEQYEDCIIYSPCDGVVTAMNVSVGDTNVPGSTLLTIEDNENMKLVLDVDEKNILKLNEGMPAIITNDYLPDTEISGEITRVVKVKSSANPLTDGGQSSGGYCVEVSLKNDNTFYLGMSAKAKVYLTKKDPILAVPYDCVETDEDGKTSVLIAKELGNNSFVAQKVYFEAGEEADYYVEVLSGEIKKGDYVINSFTIKDGDVFQSELPYQETEMGEGGMIE